jgi:NTE family protein
VAEDPRFTGELVRLMGVELQRSRGLEQAAPDTATVIALVPAHEGLPLDQIATELVSELQRGGMAVRLDGPSATPFDPAAEAELLDRYENESDQVVLVVAVALAHGREADEWGDFCLRQADRVLVIAGERPVPAGLAGRTVLTNCDLMFLGGSSGAPSHIGEWVDALAPHARHALTPGSGVRPSAAIAARRLAGRSVGIVLSGGGARAFAHIGVLDELLAAGIAIDRVGGVSMGAFIRAMFAMGMDPEEVDARCYEEWVRRNPLNDYRLPRHSLIRGDRVTAMLERNLPGQVDELPLDYFCTSGDLPTAELVIHRRGPVYLAVGASMSLPGLVAPQLAGGRMLVDGGVLNNLPVDVMAATGEGPVIAVDVTNRFEPPAAGAEDENGRGRRARRRQVGDPRLPGFTETLTRALMLGSMDAADAARMHAELVITPQSDGVGMLEFHQLDRVREEGRRAARAALETLPESGLGAAEIR